MISDRIFLIVWLSVSFYLNDQVSADLWKFVLIVVCFWLIFRVDLI